MLVAITSIVIDTTYGLIIGIFVFLFLFAEKMIEAFSEIAISSGTDNTSVLQITTR